MVTTRSRRRPSVSSTGRERRRPATLRTGWWPDARPRRPTLRYYRSDDGGTITDGDTEEGAERTDEKKEIGALFAGQTRRHQIILTAPSAAGRYYYGACVSGNSGLESDITNNCSGSVAVVVSN